MSQYNIFGGIDEFVHATRRVVSPRRKRKPLGPLCPCGANSFKSAKSLSFKCCRSAGLEIINSRVCPMCLMEFTYVMGRGRDRIFCGKRCVEKHRKQKWTADILAAPLCSTPGCQNHISRLKHWCENCYCLIRRNGTASRQAVKTSHVLPNGYVIVYSRHDHPLVNKKGHVYEHRAVLYDAIGPGAHPCAWCGVALGWNRIVVDHLNDNKRDNARDNLVVSCNDCNRARGAMIPFLKRLLPNITGCFPDNYPRDGPNRGDRMMFTLQIELTHNEPDFRAMYPQRTEALIHACAEAGGAAVADVGGFQVYADPETDAEYEERLSIQKKQWLNDTRVDIADIIRLAVQRIMRGEKAADIKDLNGQKVGRFEFAE